MRDSIGTSLENGVLLDGRFVVDMRIHPQRIEVLHRALDLVYLALTKRLLVGKLIRALCFDNKVELGLLRRPASAFVEVQRRNQDCRSR